MSRALADEMATFPLARGYSWSEDSSQRRTQQELAELLRIMALSITLVFLLMGVLFESVLLPVSVLATIPFAVVGAYWALYLTGTQMDSIGWIGIIILVGVVVNNGIVLLSSDAGATWARSRSSSAAWASNAAAAASMRLL